MRDKCNIQMARTHLQKQSDNLSNQFIPICDHLLELSNIIACDQNWHSKAEKWELHDEVGIDEVGIDKVGINQTNMATVWHLYSRTI